MICEPVNISAISAILRLKCPDQFFLEKYRPFTQVTQTQLRELFAHVCESLMRDEIRGVPNDRFQI